MALVHILANLARLRNTLGATVDGQQMAASEYDMNNSPQNQNDRSNSDAEKKRSGQQDEVSGDELGGLAGKQGHQQQKPANKDQDQPTSGNDQKGSVGSDNRR
ncbi:hypothetical protein SAMN04487782_1546 [Stenotrophomonas maltophilia]|nr:hypothetical protein SAMN04487782_1546 [Stenotrophomonas maltophilia]